MICFTCHVPLEPDEVFGGRGIRMAPGDLPRYREMVERARDYGAGAGVRVLRGIEAEIFPDPAAMDRMARTVTAEGFDFVLGSLHHHIGGYRDWLAGQGIVDDPGIIRTYFRQLAEGVRSGLYDSIAHPDVIRIYGTVEPFAPAEYRAEIEGFLDALAEEDHCMEVNTSGLIKGVHEVHPHPAILDWAAERGVRLTMGSDSHAPGQVGQKFGETRDLLRAKGFRSLCYFENRERKEVEL